MFVDSHLADSIGTLTLNQPAKRNALSHALIEELIAGLGEFQQAQARAVIIRAAPDVKVWSAGHDITEIPPGADPLQYSAPLERLLRAIGAFPAPVIAMVACPRFLYQGL